MTSREDVLKMTRSVITSDREAVHGEAVDTFERIAAMWTAYLNGAWTFRTVDVAAMMALLKIARLSYNQGNLDNYIDGCGYLALGAEMSRAE